MAVFGWIKAVDLVRRRHALMQEAFDRYWNAEAPVEEDAALDALAALGWQDPPHKLTSADLFGDAAGFGMAVDPCMYAAAPMVTNPPWRR